MNRQLGSVTLPFKQRGIASLIVVLLVGLEVLALSAATLYNVHGTQERQIAAHAQVNSQVAAWTAVENTRLYLSSLDQAGIDALAAGALATNNANVAIEITNVANAPTPNTKRVTALVTATATAGEAASRVQVVYDLSAGAAAGTTTLGGSMLKGNTEISGGMDFIGANGKGVDFIVDGNLKITGVGISGEGLNKLTVTGDVEIDSGVKATTIYANGNAKITSGAGVKNIYALGNVTTNSGASGIDLIQADGNVVIAMSSPVGKADALGTMTVTGWGHHGILTSKGKMTLGSGSDGGSATVAQTQGDLDQGSPGNGFNKSTSSLLANGNITCSGNAIGTNFTKIQTGGTDSGTCKGTTNITKNDSPKVQVLEPQKPYPVAKPIVDVWGLKNQANYVYEYIDGKMMVTISNVAGVANGQYILIDSAAAPLYSYEDGWNVFVCKDKTNSCQSPNGPNANKIYLNNALNQSGSLSYDEKTKVWSLGGGNIAPGVAWFDGSINITGGTYFNTLLATGNISTAGGAYIIGANVAGNQGLCKFENKDKTLLGVPEPKPIDKKYSPSYYQKLIPTNLCDTSENPKTKVVDGVTYTLLKPNTIGNIALAAGGTNPNVTPSKYTGGNINLSSLFVAYGNIMAGEQLRTSGNTSIYGQFLAADLNIDTKAENAFTAKFVANLKTLAVDFAPEEVPNMGQPAVAPTATMVWSQYP